MEPSAISAVSAKSGLYQQVVSEQPPARQSGKETLNVANEAASKVVDTVNVSSSTTMKNLDTVRVIEQMHAHLNLLAKGVRETNESVNKATEQIDAMKNSLQAVIKNFPPFPVESEERNNRLMEYTSLRKQLLSLMVPPPPPAPYEKVRHLWDALFDKEGKILPATVEPLEKTSGDEQLKYAIQGLDKTSLQLSDMSNKITQALVQP